MNSDPEVEGDGRGLNSNPSSAIYLLCELKEVFNFLSEWSPL